MGNELTITKEQTARFVHDAVEMETAVFTLDRAIEECEKRRDEKLDRILRSMPNPGTEMKAEDKIRSRQRELDSVKRERYDSYRKNYRRWSFDTFPFFESDTWKVFGGSILLGLFAVPILLTIVLYFICGESWTSEHMPIICIIGVCLLPALVIVIYFVWWLIDGYNGAPMSEALFERDKQRRIKNIEANLALDERQLALIQSQRFNDNQEVQTQQRIFGIQISDLRTKRSQIKSTLSQFYDLNVIPPDYRYMDCAIMLDQIFRNDLADTMRDAIKIYEERVFRGEVIKGMDKICSMLGNLSASMAVIGQRLSSIDSNVKMMSQDLYTFSERIAAGQAKQQKATEQLIRETELSRYATEQVAESSKNLEWFERRRQGWV